MSILEENTVSNEERKLSGIQRFLCICAGVDKEILKQCPTEWNKYTGIGATILFTGILASLSGGYALYTIFRKGDLTQFDTSALLPAILFGILWGLIIFNLDRFIVSTFRKSEVNVWWKKIGRELLQASPRIILAIIIAIVISKPIEIKIFEKRLVEQINNNMLSTKEGNGVRIDNIFGVKEKEQEYSNKLIKDSILQQELATDPQIVKDIIKNELANANLALKDIKNLNNPKIKNHEQAISNIKANQSNYRDVQDINGNVAYRSLTKEANDNIGYHSKEKRKLNSEITSKQRDVEKIDQQILVERKKHKDKKTEEITENKHAIKIAGATKDSVINEADTEKGIVGKGTEEAFTNNFITQIEALGDLTANDKSMWWTSLMITLLFLTIELAPILTKLITKRGPYDEILDRTEYETMIEQKEIISRRNSEINEILIKAEEAAKLRGEIFVQSQKIKLDAELRNNKIITDKIAEYQQELALLAIEKWREEEIEKVNTTYIRTNSN